MPEAGASLCQKLGLLHARSWGFFMPEAGASSRQKLGLLLTRSWGFFSPTSISSSPFNSSISIHVILNLHPPSSFACAYDPDRTFSLPPLPSFTSNHRIVFLPSPSLPPRSTPQLSHGSPPDFLHKLKGAYTRPLFRGVFWSMGYQCFASVGGGSLCTVPQSLCVATSTNFMVSL